MNIETGIDNSIVINNSTIAQEHKLANILGKLGNNQRAWTNKKTSKVQVEYMINNNVSVNIIFQECIVNWRTIDFERPPPNAFK